MKRLSDGEKLQHQELFPHSENHTCSSWGNKLVIVGGKDWERNYHSDVHILDTDTLIWTNGIPPIPDHGEDEALELSKLEPDAEAYIKYLRPSELVGVDCIEQYLPHRVARQFGFDQDIPGQVARRNRNNETAWAFYERPVSDKVLYIPPVKVEMAVTSRYMEWWTRSTAGSEAGPSTTS